MAARASNSTGISEKGASGAGVSHRDRERQLVFEFTKRKRWDDILISEVPDAILLVLNPHGVVLYCGPAIYDLLGWQPENVVDRAFLDFVKDDDSQTFANCFHRSLSTHQDLLTYVRLSCKFDASRPAKLDSGKVIRRELLFEVTGRPMEEHESGYGLYFAVAKPYPSRNMAIMNTFLELKIENERLSQQLKERRLELAQAESGSCPNTLSTSTDTMHGYSSTHLVYGMTGDRLENATSNNAQGMSSTFVQSAYGPSYDDSNLDDGGQKKRFKKVAGSDPQHVCVACGRTSSPEWRKGPKGPKTLCNACGLRWAKRAKKPDEPPTGSNDATPSTPKPSPISSEQYGPPQSMAATGPSTSSRFDMVSISHSPHGNVPPSPMSLSNYQHTPMGMDQPMPMSNAFVMPPLPPTHPHSSMSASQQYHQQTFIPPQFQPTHDMGGQPMWNAFPQSHDQAHGRYHGY